MKWFKSQEEKRAQQLATFITLVNSLDPLEFSGVAQMLKVRLSDPGDGNGKKQARPYIDILEDLIDNFIALNSTQKKNLIKIVREAVQESEH